MFNNPYINRAVKLLLPLCLLSNCSEKEYSPCAKVTIEPKISVVPYSDSYKIGDTLLISFEIKVRDLNLETGDTISISQNLNINVSFGFVRFISASPWQINSINSFSIIRLNSSFEFHNSENPIAKRLRFSQIVFKNGYFFSFLAIPKVKGVYGIGVSNDNFWLADNCIGNYIPKLINGHGNLHLRDSITGIYSWGQPNKSGFYFIVQ